MYYLLPIPLLSCRVFILHSMPYTCHITYIYLISAQWIGRVLPERPPDKPTLQGVHIISGSVEERSLQKSTIKIVIVGQLFKVLYCLFFH